MSKKYFFKCTAIALALAAAPSCGSASDGGSPFQPGQSGVSGSTSAGGAGGGTAAVAGSSSGSPAAGVSGGGVGGVGLTTAGSAQGGNANAGQGGDAVGGGQASSGAAGLSGSLNTGGSPSAAGSANSSGSSGSSGSGGAGTWIFPPSVIKPRIMIVGDSISAGPGCYKKYLLKTLSDNHYTKFEFVGAYTDGCGGGVKHSAVSCSTAAQYTQASFMLPNCSPGKTFSGLTPLVNTHKPDLIMLQLGVNDIWGGASVDSTLTSYENLVKQARAVNPNVVLIVARIQKIAPSCKAGDAVTAKAQSLVNAVPAWAQKSSLAQSPIFVADLWTNSDWSKAETTDCIHPNDIGAQRMGMNWYNALKVILRPD